MPWIMGDANGAIREIHKRTHNAAIQHQIIYARIIL